jgi:hypothetical protein
MEQRKVVSLTQHNAERICTANAVNRSAAPTLPGANRLWELLDKNIDLGVWLQAH